MSNDDSTVLQNEHLQNDVATPSEDNPNLHSVTVGLEPQNSNVIDVPGENVSVSYVAKSSYSVCMYSF